MKKLIIVAVLVLIVIVGINRFPDIRGVYKSQKPLPLPSQVSSNLPESAKNNTDLPLKVPNGFSLSVYARDLVNPRDLIFDSKGMLLASITGKGKVVAIRDGKTETVLGDLNKPHGLAFYENKLFVAETDAVKVYDYNPETLRATNAKKIIDLPSGGNHFTRSLLINNGKLFVSTGSTCNVCEEKDSRRAAIWFSNLDGTDFKPYAVGLRNSVFMTVKPGTAEIWSTNMGRDRLGDNIPPETVNIIKEGAHYGWPYCYGNKIADKETNNGNTKFDCSKMEAPKIEFQAHSAPLGLAFFGEDLLVAYHGSWNRSVPAGYKVVKFTDGREEDFVTGWLNDKGEAWGRPADIVVSPDGSTIFISDDKAGLIYSLRKI